MKLLLIAPQPFYRERGTPIAVKLLGETLCEAGYSVDLLTYHEGQNISIPGLTIYRIARPPFVKNIPIGFSWKKLVCDAFLVKEMIKLIRKKSYPVVHAVEETVFPGVILKHFFRYRLIYDMDSSLVDQLVEKYQQIKRIQTLLYRLEGWAIRGADFILPVCQSLADKVQVYKARERIRVLYDVPLESNCDDEQQEDLRKSLNIGGCLALYVGNLEHYQGIHLLLEGLAKIPATHDCSLVFIGGESRHIREYLAAADRLGLSKSVHFVGPRPLKCLPHYLAQADILVSPRSKGENTPMKLYAYLASGKPVLATRIKSHTQVLSPANARLVELNAKAIAEGLMELAKNPGLRKRLGQKGKELAESTYSLEAYKERLLTSYALVGRISDCS